MKFGKLVGAIALLLGLYLLWRVRFIGLLVFTAVALATVLNRIVRRLTRWRLERGLAIMITFVMIFALIAIAMAVIVPRFIAQVSQWLDRAPLEIAQISIWLNQLDDQVPAELSSQLQQLDTFIRDIPQVVRSVFNNFFLLLRGTLSMVVNVLLVLVVTIMLLANPVAYRRAFVLLFPQFYRHRLQEILDHCERSLVAWGIGILFNMVVITLMSFAGLAIIDVPLPIGNALIAGILTFIPNVGPVLSVVPPALLGLLEAPWKAAAVVVLYIVIQQVEGNLLTPMVMEHQVSLLPALTLISQLICGVLFGFMGLFLALPLVVVGQVWLQELLVRDVMNNWRDNPFANGNRTTHREYRS
ncbi:AI-2E family transporter [Vacuolonema iberomarrocanum]|uniref:AI-2E family transporter n=1 Tax=Vacuolonema iberomarrocanum TaxID=3454632 RepID=UPI001A0E5F91|nr:AI-2E family transporter [filamentous cyanobacterium LEGE 07170]